MQVDENCGIDSQSCFGNWEHVGPLSGVLQMAEPQHRWQNPSTRHTEWKASNPNTRVQATHPAFRSFSLALYASDFWAQLHDAGKSAMPRRANPVCSSQSPGPYVAAWRILWGGVPSLEVYLPIHSRQHFSRMGLDWAILYGVHKIRGLSFEQHEAQFHHHRYDWHRNLRLGQQWVWPISYRRSPSPPPCKKSSQFHGFGARWGFAQRRITREEYIFKKKNCNIFSFSIEDLNFFLFFLFLYNHHDIVIIPLNKDTWYKHPTQEKQNIISIVMIKLVFLSVKSKSFEYSY